MRIPLLPVLCVLVVGLLLDCYIYRRMRMRRVPRVWLLVYALISAAVSIGMLGVDLWPKKAAADQMLKVMMWTLFAYASVYIPKFLYVFFSLIGLVCEKIFRRSMVGFDIAGGILAVSLFGLLWWGALVNRFNIQVREVEVQVAGLPSEFDGYRIAQISDIHSGTYGSDTTFLAKLVEQVNAQHTDMIAFTGDIVNRHSAELGPFMSTLSRLSAPDGVYSVMGNHDYGDYYRWPDEQAHKADAVSLKNMQRSMGWHMLNNETATLRRGSDSLMIIGVENIGDAPFPVYGSLSRAYPRLDDDAVKILLSHNPAHWTDSIADRTDRNIALTLAGHTHAMQMELFGLSPAVFRYPTWGGLYADNSGRHLYVNIGAGEVGFPARVGATPEITVITLRRK